MSNAGIFMFIFGLCVLLMGIYMFTGHELGIMTLRPAFRGLGKEEWKKVGKGTMIASVIIFMIAALISLLDR